MLFLLHSYGRTWCIYFLLSKWEKHRAKKYYKIFGNEYETFDQVFCQENKNENKYFALFVFRHKKSMFLTIQSVKNKRNENENKKKLIYWLWTTARFSKWIHLMAFSANHAKYRKCIIIGSLKLLPYHLQHLFFHTLMSICEDFFKLSVCCRSQKGSNTQLTAIPFILCYYFIPHFSSLQWRNVIDCIHFTYLAGNWHYELVKYWVQNVL